MINLPFSDILPCGVCRFSDLNGLLECRAKARLPENPKSVIVYLFPYYLGDNFYKETNISKYAVCEDYHNIAGDYLSKISGKMKEEFPNNEFVFFCDNSPIKEVDAAFLCGLGVKGRNSLLINKDYGSYVFIGEIVTDLEISEYSLPEDRDCLNCGKCEKACLGEALKKGGVNKENCFSHISQKKGEFTEWEMSLFRKSDSIWGCDICQNVCPMNENIKTTPIKEFYETAKTFYEIGDNIEKRAFAWRGEGVIKRNFEIKYCKQEKNNL